MNIIDKLKTKSLSGDDIMKMVNYKAHVYTYSDLARFKNIEKAFYPHDVIFLLYETKKFYGHWTCLIKHKNKIEVFDSYGLFPDEELNFTNDIFRISNNMVLPHLTALLYFSKIPIEYNDHQLQEWDPKITTCGRWVVGRVILKDLHIDKFAKLFSLGGVLDPDDLITIFTYYV